MSTKQNDRCHFTKNPLERKNFIRANVQAVLKSCHCKNSLLQSLILVVWLNNISPSLLLRLWLRHRVFLGEKIESTAGVILRWSSSIRDLKQRRFWATHVNRKWGLLLFICLDVNKLVLLSFFSLLKTIYPRVSTKSFPSDAKSPLPVDVRRSKTLLLKLPIIIVLQEIATQ